MKRFLSLILFAVLLTLSLVGCMGGGEQRTTSPQTTPPSGGPGVTTPSQTTEPSVTTPPVTTEPPATTPSECRVTVEDGEHYNLLTNKDGVTVPYGGTATFRIAVIGNYTLNFSAGTYNASTKTLTVENVTSDLVIRVSTSFFYKVTVAGDGFTVEGGSPASVEEGEDAVLKLIPASGKVIAWVSGGEWDPETGKVTVRDVTENVRIDVVTVSVDGACFIYYMNGGSASGKDYFIEKLDISHYTAPNAKWDDGSFTRAGYALLEYNTKADGSGTAYGLGSKIDLVGNVTPLYCIWAEETPASAFTTSGTSELTITGYNGTAATVVIPEMIDGKPVTAIAAGAFSDESFTTLFITKRIKTVAAGAFVGCSRLDTLYLSDTVVSIPDEAFDAATYSNFKHFYLNAATAPRFANTYDGGYRVKWDRLMAGKDGDMIVFVSGSSSLHGVATKYLEALFDNKYTVVNYGTVRTTNNMVYMEAVANFVDEGDIVIYAPENSIYQFGESDLTYKLFRDLEGSLNVWRYVDISNYDKVFSAFSDYQNRRLSRAAGNYSMTNASTDAMGDEVRAGRNAYANESKFSHPATHRGDFWITFDERVKPTTENLSVPDDTLWTSLTEHADYVRSVVDKIEATGAKCYFGFGSVNECALTEEAKTEAQQKAFADLISESFGIEILGKPANHIFAWKYLLPDGGSDFHLNDYGRPINTYSFYVEICEKLGLTPKGMKDLGTSFPGCIFE